jgi:hypothetical protein
MPRQPHGDTASTKGNGDWGRIKKHRGPLTVQATPTSLRRQESGSNKATNKPNQLPKWQELDPHTFVGGTAVRFLLEKPLAPVQAALGDLASTQGFRFIPAEALYVAHLHARDINGYSRKPPGFLARRFDDAYEQGRLDPAHSKTPLIVSTGIGQDQLTLEVLPPTDAGQNLTIRAAFPDPKNTLWQDRMKLCKALGASAPAPEVDPHGHLVIGKTHGGLISQMPYLLRAPEMNEALTAHSPAELTFSEYAIIPQFKFRRDA